MSEVRVVEAMGTSRVSRDDAIRRAVAAVARRHGEIRDVRVLTTRIDDVTTDEPLLHVRLSVVVV